MKLFCSGDVMTGRGIDQILGMPCAPQICEPWVKDARDHGDQVARRVPAGRVGQDDDMAGAAIYLASRAGDYVVGSTLIVDGGLTWARG